IIFAEIKLGAALTATLITSTAFRKLAGRSAPTLPMKRIRHAPLAARLTCYLSIRLMRKAALCPEVALNVENRCPLTCRLLRVDRTRCAHREPSRVGPVALSAVVECGMVRTRNGGIDEVLTHLLHSGRRIPLR